MITDVGSVIPFVICGGIIIIVLALPSFLLSRVIKLEHDEFHEQWVKDGKPDVMPYWFPLEEIRSPGFRSSSRFVGTKLLFKTPNWVKGHKSATKLLKYYRFIYFFFLFTLIGATVLTFVLIWLSVPR